MDLLKEHFFSFIGLLLSGFAGWLFGRPKQRVELQSSELDNVDKAIHIYRENVDTYRLNTPRLSLTLKRLTSALKELENAVETLLLATKNK